MKNTISPIIQQYKLQTRLLINAAEGIGEKISQQRVSSLSNHVAWITGHVVSTRFMLSQVLGLPVQEPFPEMFGKGKGMDENIAYPGMDELIKEWPVISEKFLSKLSELTDAQLESDSPIKIPVEDQTLGGFIAFLAHHEAYHIGQIGLARRIFALPAMKYS
jgi:hypothetical protein